MGDMRRMGIQNAENSSLTAAAEEEAAQREPSEAEEPMALQDGHVTEMLTLLSHCLPREGG